MVVQNHVETKSYPAVNAIQQDSIWRIVLAPARGLHATVLEECEAVARRAIASLGPGAAGVFRVELFVTKNHKVLLNEVAPRPHHSGNQTIEANITSQYEQHLRAILGMPLGDTSLTSPTAMVNLLGEAGFEGLARYEGLDEVLAQQGVHVHLYGKKMTKPFRKMGHVTIVDGQLDRLKEKVQFVKEHLKVIT